jgi:hypothetical protein
MSRVRDAASTVWAITSYYNPMHYKSRIENFRRFRNELLVPLAVVELGYGKDWDLNTREAEIVIHVPGVSTLWQKERLLNVALESLPRHVSHVAWLDCDIILENIDWPREGVETLRRKHLVQLFSHLYDLDRGETPPSRTAIVPEYTGLSVGHQVQNGHVLGQGFLPTNTLQMRQTAFGLAWMAKRQMMARHGFYDGMVMVSGDRAIVFAALGRFYDAITVRASNYREC